MKKIRFLSLALSLILLFTATSCQNKNGSGDKSNGNKREDSGLSVPQMSPVKENTGVSDNTPYFSAKQIDLYDDLQQGESLYMNNSVITENGIYILLTITDNDKLSAFTEEMESKDEWDEALYLAEYRKFTKFVLVILDVDGQVKDRVDMRANLPDEVEYVESLHTVDNGDLLLSASGAYDEQTGSVNRLIFKIDAQGNLIDTSVPVIPESQDANEEKYYSTFAWDATGNMFLSGYVYPKNGGSGKGLIEVMDPDGNKLFSLEDDSDNVENYLYYDGTFFVDGDTVYTSFTNDEGTFLAIVDVQEQKLTEEMKLDMGLGNATLKDKRIYSSDENGVHFYDLDNQEKKSLFFWKDLDLEISRDCTPLVISEDSIFITENSYDNKAGSYNQNWYILTREDANPNAGKNIIQIGGYYISSDTAVQKAIKLFNEQNPEYRAELLDYAYTSEMQTEADDYEKMMKNMNMMILSGDIPDILIGDSYNFNFPLYASKDLFADLNTFVEKDSSFHKDDYLDMIFSLPKTDENLYYIFSSFSLEGIAVKKNSLNGKTGWTLDEMEAMIESSPKAKESYKEWTHSTFLYQLVSASLADFVDSTSQKADFNNEQFKKILNMCKKYGMPESEMNMMNERMMDEWVEPMEQLKNEDVPFQFGSLYSLEGWKRDWNLSGGGLTLAGFPSDKESLILCAPNTFLAIADNRNNKDLAWELVKSLLSLDAQKTMEYGLPVAKEALEYFIEEEKKPASDPYLAKMPEYVPLSDEGAEEFWNIINEPMKMSSYDFAIMDLIDQETQAFFADQKGIDETIRIIQERVTTHLNQL